VLSVEKYDDPQLVMAYQK